MNYTVKKGDTLDSIAKKFNVDVEDILKANKGLEYMSVLIPGKTTIFIPIDDNASTKNTPNQYDLLTMEKPPLIKEIEKQCIQNQRDAFYKMKKNKMRISMFFDGTGNNRDNTKLLRSLEKNEDDPDAKPYYKVDDTKLDRFKKIIQARNDDNLESFSNDLTNVARLEETLCQNQGNGYDFSGSIYIEGIGTQDNEGIFINGNNEIVKDEGAVRIKQLSFRDEGLISPGQKFRRARKITKLKDDSTGMATGWEYVGTKAKSKRGVEALIERIKSDVKPSEGVHLEIDAFGFSRGAAAARYFIYLIKVDPENTLGDMLAAHEISLLSVKIKFVGLYDTVAADVLDASAEELKLDVFKEVEVEKVVHLCAAEEYRKAFKLINIDSALKKGNGIELFLPGAHSDVGGSYYHNSAEGVEKKYQVFDLDEKSAGYIIRWISGCMSHNDILKSDMERLIRKGWYLDGEIEVNNIFNEINVTRKNIKNTYSYIPLQIMLDFARDTGGLIFNANEYSEFIKQDKFLTVVQTKINNYVKNHKDKKNNSWKYWEVHQTPEWKQFRHNYLHMSAHYVQSASLLRPGLRPDIGSISKKNTTDLNSFGVRLRDNVPG